MEKFFKKLSYVFVILIALGALIYYITISFGDKILCFYADKLFKENDYSSAYSVYDFISSYKPENADYQYRKTLCLSKMPLSYSVQKQLVEIAQKDDGSASEKLATDVILNFRKKIYDKFGSVYTNETLYEGVVLRWSKSSFPLTVYIDKPRNVPQYYYEQAVKSFEDWQRETEEFVKFTQINNPATAKITIKFLETGTQSSSKREYKAAITSPVIEKEKNLKQMIINVLIKKDTGDYFSLQEVKTVITHEIGHSLGLWGHSSDNRTIMYYSLDNPYDYYEKRTDTSLNEKDIATLKILYSLAPDITDNSDEFNRKERYLYPPMLFSPVDDAKNKTLLKAETLLKEHPDDLQYALSLADIYNKNGKYQDSINLMIFLLDKTSDKYLSGLLCYNISNNYISLNDFENALCYAKKSLTFSNNLDNRTLIAYIKYCKNDLDSAEKEFIYILGKNPAQTGAALGLADVYIKKKQYMKARDVLKHLIKYNPDIVNDKSFNPYKIYVIF